MQFYKTQLKFKKLEIQNRNLVFYNVFFTSFIISTTLQIFLKVY